MTLTHREILDAIGSMATDAEADAMAEILAENGIESLSEIEDDEFFALIPEAIRRARGKP